MVRKQKGGDGTWGMFTVTMILILVILLLFVYLFGKKFTFSALKEEKNEVDKVCMTRKEYEKLNNKKQDEEMVCKPKYVVMAAGVSGTDRSMPRDYRVLQDQLYPPLNRTDTMTHKMLEKNIDERNMYVPTNDTLDNYRLVGYLINKDPVGERDAGGNNWKLFARQKDRHSSDFYMIPSNNNYDIKIHIKDDMISSGERLRDVYTIPKNISFKSPMLNQSPYEFVEIPKADLATSSRYL